MKIYGFFSFADIVRRFHRDKGMPVFPKRGYQPVPLCPPATISPSRGTAAWTTGVSTVMMLLCGASAVHAQSSLFSEDWENPTHVPYGYATGASATQENLVGAGTGGSRGAVLSVTLPAGTAGALGGLQTSTVTNPSTVPFPPSQIIISFDARLTSADVPTPVYFFIQTWTGSFGSYDGFRGIYFTPTSTYQHFSSSLADMAVSGSDVNIAHSTIQVTWQISSFDGWGAGTHTIEIDNLDIFATAPEPGTLALLGMAAFPMIGLVRRRTAYRDA